MWVLFYHSSPQAERMLVWYAWLQVPLLIAILNLWVTVPLWVTYQIFMSHNGSKISYEVSTEQFYGWGSAQPEELY